MAVAEIVTIGTELLLGDIQDTNSKYIARMVRDIGIDLYRLTTIGDNAQRITATLKEALLRSDIIITTGGLGPTVDDPTREAVAGVFDEPLIYHEELWKDILQRYTRYKRVPTENNKRQAYIPKNAIAISNPVGTAPAFVYESGQKTIISLPGVPREMEYLMRNYVLDYLKQRYELQTEIIKAHVVHTISKGESSIDEIIGELETLSNPTVGLLAHPGQTDIRITAKAKSEEEAVRMIQPILDKINQLLGPYIYGYNEMTIEQCVADLLREQGLTITVIESGTNGEILGKLVQHIPQRVSGEQMDINLSSDTLISVMEEYKSEKKSDIVLATRLTPINDRQDLWLALDYQGKLFIEERSYGGPPGDALRWSVNFGLDSIRRKLLGIDPME